MSVKRRTTNHFQIRSMAVCLRSSKDNHYRFLLSVAVILSGFSTTMAAPTESLEWLTNPCGVQVQLRHGRSPAENQLRIFIKMFDNAVMSDLAELYPDSNQKQMKSSCPKVNAVLKLMTNANNFTVATYIFYEAMVEIAKFLHTVKETPVTTTQIKFNSMKRRTLYREVEANLQSVMCEFNETLTRFEPIEPRAVPVRAIQRQISSKCIPKSMNITKVQNVDIDLFKKLKKFFKQSRKILRQKKKKSSSAGPKTKENPKKKQKGKVKKPVNKTVVKKRTKH